MAQLVYWGQLNEIGITICRSLSADYDVTAVTSTDNHYDLKCDCYNQKDITWEILIRDINPSCIVYFSSEEESNDDLNRLLALAARQGQIDFVIVRQADFFRKIPVDKSIEEILCDEYSSSDFHPLVIHCSRLYGEIEAPGYLEEIYRSILKDGRLYLSYPRDAYCDVMHVEDLCSVLRLILREGTESISGHSVQVQSGYPFRHHVLIDFLKDRYAQIYVRVKNNPVQETQFDLFSSPDWSPKHNFTKDLDKVFSRIEEESQAEHRVLLDRKKKRIPDVVKYLLMLFCEEVYTRYIPTASELQYVDARTLFVVCSSLFFGKKVGFLSAVICSITNVAGCLAKGVRWYEIFYNIDNWIPVTLYFILAALFGMYQDYMKQKMASGSGLKDDSAKNQ